MSKIEKFEAKAERADRAARASIEAERKAREQKTARLRKLRLAQEAKPQVASANLRKTAKNGSQSSHQGRATRASDGTIVSKRRW